MNKNPKQHDEFFKASFGRQDVATQYLNELLPAEIKQELSIEKLERVNGSFVSPSLKEYFSDVVYRCPLQMGSSKRKKEVFVSFIFEHKSNYDVWTHLQLLRYLLDAWDEQRNQKQDLTPIIPIVIYHGEKRAWKKQHLSAIFGFDLPESLKAFVPHFDYLFTDLFSMEDRQILELGHGLLINTFMMFKHIWEPEYVLKHLELVFSGLGEPTNKDEFIVTMLVYFLKNTDLAQEKIDELKRELPKALNRSDMSTYDRIILNVKQEFEGLLAESESARLLAEKVAQEEAQRAEVDRRLTILNLHKILKISTNQIAELTNTTNEYVAQVIQEAEEDQTNQN